MDPRLPLHPVHVASSMTEDAFVRTHAGLPTLPLREFAGLAGVARPRLLTGRPERLQCAHDEDEGLVPQTATSCSWKRREAIVNSTSSSTAATMRSCTRRSGGSTSHGDHRGPRRGRRTLARMLFSASRRSVIGTPRDWSTKPTE